MVAIGFVLNNQANFSRSYVHDQLAEHGITFTPVAGLLDQQKKVPCLVENAGKPLTTGKQAECYARYQIGIDLTLVDNGKSYFQDHYSAYLLRVKAAAAVKANPADPAALTLAQQSTDLQRKADDLAAGEAMRGLLLTAYGFSLLGDRGGQAAMALFVVGGVLLVGALVIAAMGARRKQPEAVEGGMAIRSVDLLPV
jgi:hypothetical protein